ncbi:MAG: RCC1 domain-containing protein [Mycetocola sp.]
MTITETVTAPIATVPKRTAQIPVTLNQQAWTSGFTMSAHTILPERFSSAQSRTETKVPGRIAKPGLGKISAGAGQSMALTNKWLSYGWGYNANGQVGNGTTTNVLTPTWLGYAGAQDFIQVSAGGNHTVALSGDLKIYGWGARQWSIHGGTQAQNPVQISPPTAGAFSQVSAGYNHSLALGPNGRAHGWGAAWNGELGTSSSISRPTQLQNPAGIQFVQVEAGASTSYGLAADGTVWGMGSNANGRLGLGPNVSEVSKFTQIPMPGDARIVQLVSNSSTSDSHTLALTDSGEVIAWGSNSSGQGGTASDGSTPATFLVPTRIELPEGVGFTRLAAGSGVSLGLSYDGSVYSWGGRTLGYAASGNVAIPHQVPSLTANGGYIDVTAGDQHAFALGTDGKLYGWGSGQSGRLGNNSTAFQTVPVPIPLPVNRHAESSEAASGTDALTDTGAGTETEGTDSGISEDTADTETDTETDTDSDSDTKTETPDQENADPDAEDDSIADYQLPSEIDAGSVGQGGVKPGTVVLAAENENYTVWTARDQSEAICVIVLALPDGPSSSYCAEQKVFESAGISGSIDLRPAPGSEEPTQSLQTYLLPDAVDAERAAKMIPGSKAYGQMLVRFGDFRQDDSHVITLPSGDSEIELLLLRAG